MTDAWWAERGARSRTVRSAWEFATRADHEAVLRLEFPPPIAGRWLCEHPDRTGLTYGYVLFSVSA